MATKIYLDYAAASPLDRKVLSVMEPYFVDKFYNPSASYSAGQTVAKKIYEARAMVAHWLGARSSEIIFTAGGSEANNLAIHGVMRRSPKANVVVSAIEHESVLAAAERYDCRVVAVKDDGRVDLDDLAKKIDANTALVSVMYANNEIGTVQPIREISKIVAKKRLERNATDKPLLLHVDACQAANYLDLHVARLGVDMLSLNGGKIYGPKQSGALYVKAGVELQPIVDGGGQERGLRSGTENVPACIGLATALDIAQSGRQTESSRLKALQAHFFELLEQKIPTASINGSKKYRLPNNIHITLPGQDNERLLIQLDQEGIMAAAGSACSASSDTPSTVLKALGLSDDDAQASLRFTMGRGTTKAEIGRVVKVLSEFLL